MKKRVMLMLIMVIVAVLCVGCGSKLGKYDSSISELRTNIYNAENETYKISAITGRRETPYVLDGNSDSKTDFTVITVTPIKFENGKVYNYSVDINNKNYSGQFLPHPFAQTVSADIPAKASGAEIVVNIICGQQTQSVTLSGALPANAINGEKALSIALNRLKNSVSKMQAKGKLSAEIYVRITANPIDNSGGYFWYVAFIDQNMITVAVLLNCETGEVCAVRE